MEHLTLKAATTQVTDQGVFEAVISTETADREQDVVSADAMVEALKKWNRPVPLAWNHSTAAEDIIGSVEPMTAAVKDAEVVVQGQVDLDSEVGKQAWRSFKSRTIGFSFGYMTLSSTKREGGGRHLTEVDIFEITATPTPMNNETRVLSTKGKVEVETETASVTVTPEVAEEPTLDEKALEVLTALESAPEDEISQDVKDRLGKMAQALAIEDVADEDSSGDKSQTQDPPPNHEDHRRLYEMATEGLVTAPPPSKAAEPVEGPPPGELRHQVERVLLESLIGEEYTR